MNLEFFAYLKKIHWKKFFFNKLFLFWFKNIKKKLWDKVFKGKYFLCFYFEKKFTFQKIVTFNVV